MNGGYDERANSIIDRIRSLAERNQGELLLVVEYAGSSGTGHISLSGGTEIVFDFVFVNWGFNIEIRGEEKTSSRTGAFIDYTNKAEIDSILNILETRMKVPDDSE